MMFPNRFPRPECAARKVTMFGFCAAIAVCLTPAYSSADSPDSLPAKTALDDYIAKKDGSYAWSVVRTTPGEEFTGFIVDMTSQTWRKPSEVDRTVWQHWVSVVKPDQVKTDTALLFIGGGRNDGRIPDRPSRRFTQMAVAARAVVAELRMVPNQPLAFKDDNRPRREDDLIAHTWNKYMETGDATWVARMPMVKSAVRAMDTLQALLRSRQGGGVSIENFVVAGGSKRGWTTWLTGAVDKRVVAIVPIVIDVVNVIPSMEHHYAAYGFWAAAVGDYSRNRITEKRNTPEYRELIKLVDPYYYRHRLTMPKYIINSTGDQYFLPDSSQFYFDQLVGEKYLRYVPNTKHSLKGPDATESLLSYFQALIAGTSRPQFSWAFEDDGSIRVKTADQPQEVRLWQATNPDARDFRLDTIGKAYTSSRLKDEGGGTFVGRVSVPEKGWTAYFVELTYDRGGAFPLKFTTAVRVVPDVLPFEGKLEKEEENKKAAAAKD